VPIVAAGPFHILIQLKHVAVEKSLWLSQLVHVQVSKELVLSLVEALSVLNVSGAL